MVCNELGISIVGPIALKTKVIVNIIMASRDFVTHDRKIENYHNILKGNVDHPKRKNEAIHRIGPKA